MAVNLNPTQTAQINGLGRDVADKVKQALTKDSARDALEELKGSLPAAQYQQVASILSGAVGENLSW